MNLLLMYDNMKILIAAPTSANKFYCFEDYLDNALKIVCPGEKKIVLFDNTMDNGESVAYQNAYYKNKYGQNATEFECIKSDTTFCDGLTSRICKSHNDCRKYAIDNEYDYMLHLESDIFPPPNVVQELLLAKKDVVGALYNRDEGRFRRLMVQNRLKRSPFNFYMSNFDPQDCLYFVDGTVKPAHHIGLGCVLIKTSVLKKIPFRYVPNVPVHTDSYFAEDCARNKIKIFANTGLLCEHRNQNWLLDVLKNENK